MRDTNPSVPGLDVELTPTIRLLRRLGSGGMGTVWAAYHATLGTEVAVKLLSEERVARMDLLARVGREVKAASRVKSPHVVHMIDCGAATDGRPYLVMELLEGRDLGEHLESRGALPPGEVVAIVRQIAQALRKAHEQGIVHRDVKPSNVFLCDGSDPPFVKLLDFGIAQLPQGDGSAPSSTGGGAGTPMAMSPEQLVGGEPIDHLSDIWALGVLVYRSLTGLAPYHGETLGALALAIHNRPAPSMRAANPALPAALDVWFARACARRKEERFPDVVEAMRALEEAAVSEPDALGPLVATSAGVVMSASDSPTLASVGVAPPSPRWRRMLSASAVLALVFPALAVGAQAFKAPPTSEDRSAARASDPVPAPLSPPAATPSSASRALPAPAPSAVAAEPIVTARAAPARRAPASSPRRPPLPAPAPLATGPASAWPARPLIVPTQPPVVEDFPHERH